MHVVDTIVWEKSSGQFQELCIVTILIAPVTLSCQNKQREILSGIADSDMFAIEVHV